jgi:hypothetical protein
MIEYLCLASICGVLPSTKLGFHKSSVLSCAIFVIQVIAEITFIIFFYHMLTEFYNSGYSQPTRTKITKVTALFNVFLDQCNVCAIIAFSLQVPNLTHKFLSICARNDEILQFNDKPWTSIRMYFFTMVTPSVVIARNLYLYFSKHYSSVTTSLMLGYIHAMILFSEQYVSYMNQEIKSRLKFINEKLRCGTRSTLTQYDVELLQGAFKELTGCQNLLAKKVSKVMLFNLAQLLLMIIFRSLNAFLFCVLADAESAKSTSWCGANLVFTCDCAWRFSMITWCCGSLQAEV